MIVNLRLCRTSNDDRQGHVIKLRLVAHETTPLRQHSILHILSRVLQPGL